MWNEDEIIIAAAAAFVVWDKKKRKRKKCWVRPYLQERAHGGGTNLMANLITDDQLTCGGHFKNFLQAVSGSDFEILLNKIGPIITKEDTNWRRAIPAKERLMVTLRFLATGDSYHSMMYLFKISKQAISLIIPEVCDALTKVLEKEVEVCKVPKY